MARKKIITENTQEETLDNYEIIDYDGFNELSGFADLTMTDPEQEKVILSNISKMVGSNIDKRKQKEALKSISILERISDLLYSENSLENIEIKTARDIRDLAEARRVEIQNIENLRRLDTADAEGNAGHTQIGIKVVGSNGNETSVFVKAK